MLLNAGILFFGAELSDIMRAARSEFVLPAFIMQVAIIILSMTPLGKIIEFGRVERMAIDDLDGDYHRAQHRSRAQWPGEVVA